MSRYFMGHTPLAELEREMMEPRRGAGPPAFRGAVCCLRLRMEDEMCRRCREVQCRDNTYHRCPAEPRPTEALSYREAARRCFQGAVPPALWERIAAEVDRLPSFTYTSGQKIRLIHALRLVGCPSGEKARPQALAALYLLTASDTLWQRAEVTPADGALAVRPIRQKELGLQEEVLYRMARGLQRSTAAVSLHDLADERLVSAETLRLVVNGILAARYGGQIMSAVSGEGAARI